MSPSRRCALVTVLVFGVALLAARTALAQGQPSAPPAPTPAQVPSEPPGPNPGREPRIAERVAVPPPRPTSFPKRELPGPAEAAAPTERPRHSARPVPDGPVLERELRLPEAVEGAGEPGAVVTRELSDEARARAYGSEIPTFRLPDQLPPPEQIHLDAGLVEIPMPPAEYVEARFPEQPLLSAEQAKARLSAPTRGTNPT